jgi:RNA polymerase sigma-70 factor (ECF subfamily)
MTPAPDTRDAPDPREAMIEHLPKLRAYALSLTRQPAQADDLVQDTIVKAWTRFDSFCPGTNLRSWLLAILRNTFLSDLRRQHVEQAAAEAQPLAYCLPTHDGPLAMRDFLRAFDRLSTEHREILTLVGVLELSYAEAAEALDVQPGTVKSRVNRARQHLVRLLDLGDDETIMPDQFHATLQAAVAASDHDKA